MQDELDAVHSRGEAANMAILQNGQHIGLIIVDMMGRDLLSDSYANRFLELLDVKKMSKAQILAALFMSEPLNRGMGRMRFLSSVLKNKRLDEDLAAAYEEDYWFELEAVGAEKSK